MHVTKYSWLKKIKTVKPFTATFVCHVSLQYSALLYITNWKEQLHGLVKIE